MFESRVRFSLPCRRALWTGAAALVVAVCGSPRAFAQIEEVKASHILVGSKEEAAKVRAEILAEGATPQAFAKACRKYSKDPYTKPLGGDVGWFPKRGKMDERFSDAAFALQIDQISEPVTTGPERWHLIRMVDRRTRDTGKRETPRPSTPDTTGTPATAGGDPDTLVPTPPDTGAEGTEGAEGAEGAAEPVVASGARRPLRRAVNIILSIESVQSFRLPDRANNFRPEQAVELELRLKNESEGEVTVPHVSLLPLGFEVTRKHDGKRMTADYSSIAEPDAFFVPLAQYGVIGTEVSINDYYKTLTAEGRYDLEWKAETFFLNLESLHPKAKEFEGYEEIKKSLSTTSNLRIDKVRRDGATHWRSKRYDPYVFSILPSVRTGEKLYARMTVRNATSPVVIELDTTRQLVGVQHFVRLVSEGFYDRLVFHDVRDGDFVVAGDPQGTGTGAPSTRLPRVRNDRKVPHEEGTVSFISRSLRSQGPIRGGEIGSIFFVCLKPHPEWNDVHVPFGKVISGLEVLETVRLRQQIESLVILPASAYGGPGAASDGGVSVVRGNPEVIIKTSKGDVRVTLLETQARNTVANFITLAEDGFFDKADDGGKQRFFELLASEDQGRIAIHAGSPTNGFEGGKNYKIPDEVNTSRFVKGAVVVTKMQDAEGGYVPNSGSTQFFICLQDIPYFDALKAFTVFGQVQAESLPILDKLEKDDEIEKVEVTKKRARSYANFRKIY